MLQISKQYHILAVIVKLKQDAAQVPASGFIPASLYNRAVCSWIFSCRKRQASELVIQTDIAHWIDTTSDTIFLTQLWIWKQQIVDQETM